ncbi:hypothetical protein [Endozoicomonas sp. SESOKO1]|uniref:hypothetical protein n=1 Tax=Endozoicomonas sp. SESOKO1 TaxID=2828742 RepID=UPI00214992D2|nr:hypothetical protein [Endozoicomonas sp. SESOKO1]
MLRRTRFSLSIPESRLRPTKKEWFYPWPLVTEDFFTEDLDEADEYIQEWNFSYPGQKALQLVAPVGMTRFAKGNGKKIPCGWRYVTPAFLATSTIEKDPAAK